MFRIWGHPFKLRAYNEYNNLENKFPLKPQNGIANERDFKSQKCQNKCQEGIHPKSNHVKNSFGLPIWNKFDAWGLDYFEEG